MFYYLKSICVQICQYVCNYVNMCATIEFNSSYTKYIAAVHMLLCSSIVQLKAVLIQNAQVTLKLSLQNYLSVAVVKRVNVSGLLMKKSHDVYAK